MTTEKLPPVEKCDWTAFEMIWEFCAVRTKCLPWTVEKQPGQEGYAAMSKAELRRHLDQSAILLNGKKPKSKDIVEWPIEQLVFFPKNDKKRVTII